MAEWLYEAGIGEHRAALVQGGRILEMAIERDDDVGPRVGATLSARLTRKADASGRGMVMFDDGSTAQLIPVPAGVAEGARVMVEVVRESLREGADTKPLRVRAAAAGAVAKDGPGLLRRIDANGLPIRRLGAGDNLLDEHGWSEAMEEAARGIVAAPEVLLRISPTPAMTLIDVDGAAGAAELAIAGAREAGRAIRRFGIAGSIGIDLPTLAGKADRQAAAAALDASLPQPFERTAVNGFGFVQIIRKRERPSLMELLRADPVRAASMAALRAAERHAGAGGLTLTVAPDVARDIKGHPDWLKLLERRRGGSIAIAIDDALPIGGHHVH